MTIAVLDEIDSLVTGRLPHLCPVCLRPLVLEGVTIEATSASKTPPPHGGVMSYIYSSP